MVAKKEEKADDEASLKYKSQYRYGHVPVRVLIPIRLLVCPLPVMGICTFWYQHIRMTKQRPFLEAQNFRHKLQILLEAIIGCKTLSETRRSHDYF